MEEGKKYAFFQHCECEYFPCHEVQNIEDFNCLFCYCPLYALGNRCGGNFRYTKSGIKDCSKCSRPHEPGGYDYVLSKFKLLAELAKEREE